VRQPQRQLHHPLLRVALGEIGQRLDGPAKKLQPLGSIRWTELRKVTPSKRAQQRFHLLGTNSAAGNSPDNVPACSRVHMPCDHRVQSKVHTAGAQRCHFAGARTVELSFESSNRRG
jgi:hypothetical protein